MNWMSNVVPPKIRSLLRRDTPENLWVKCPESGQLVFHKDLEANLMVVPGSGLVKHQAEEEGHTALGDLKVAVKVPKIVQGDEGRSANGE